MHEWRPVNISSELMDPPLASAMSILLDVILFTIDPIENQELLKSLIASAPLHKLQLIVVPALGIESLDV
jgi:hypothetical protein